MNNQEIILLFALPVISLLLISFSAWYHNRMLKACRLRFEILNLCSVHVSREIKNGNFDINYSAYNWCYDFLPNCNKMIFSKKPLTIEAYLKESELNELLG